MKISKFDPAFQQSKSTVRKMTLGVLGVAYNFVQMYAGMGVYHTARALRWLASKAFDLHSWVMNVEAMPRNNDAVDVRTMINELRRFREAYGSPVPFEMDIPDGGDHAI